jgi:hypothetical protein
VTEAGLTTNPVQLTVPLISALPPRSTVAVLLTVSVAWGATAGYTVRFRLPPVMQHGSEAMIQ